MKRISILATLLGFLLLALPLALPRAADGEIGYLRTRIDPAAAGVFVEGEYYGAAYMFGFRDRPIKLEPGEYQVEIKDPRYKTLIANVTIKPDKWAVIRHSLTPLPLDYEGPYGELITEGYGNAAIYLNGKYYANASAISASYRSLLLPPGDYDMKIVPVDGGEVMTREITVNADETLVLSMGGAPVRRP